MYTSYWEVPTAVNKAIVLAVFFAFILGVASTLITQALMQSTWHIENRAVLKVVGVDVYQDSALTIPVVSIDWGILEPGENKNYSCYIVNRSNVPVVLSLATENWQPTNASQFITLTWNYDGEPISVGGFAPVILSLHVDLLTMGITAFSFDITIIGSG
jgi:hypothetical protein